MQGSDLAEEYDSDRECGTKHSCGGGRKYWGDVRVGERGVDDFA